METLVLLDALAVALRATQHEHVAALREDAEDPLAPVLARLREGRVDEDVVVDAGLAAGRDAVRHRHDARLVRAAERGQDRLSGVREDDECGDALRDHALDVGDRLLRVALTVRIGERGHVRTLLRFVARRGGRDEAPAVSSEPVGQPERDLLRAAPRRKCSRPRGRRRCREHHRCADERKGEKRATSPLGHRSCPSFRLGELPAVSGTTS